ncbi:POU domain, class 4, transcription factor 2 [Hemiscyllium ocellatum]|uniref:POU domain, class 4, transcription factor 2 n=1 Tax=Hemiscyllium ocellatum TaxID=170820 RepID=UPI002965DA48|nr:POU domain, class 4, transcription factor 2 [Hemiscyllium ocellatum]
MPPSSSSPSSSSSSLAEPKYSSLHSSPASNLSPSSSSSSSGRGGSSETMCRVYLPTAPSNIFGGLDESLVGRAEALAAVEIGAASSKSQPFKPDASYHTMNSIPCSSSSASISSHPPALPSHPHHPHPHHPHPHPPQHHPQQQHPHHHPQQQQHHPPPQNLDGELLEHMSPGLGLPTITGPDGSVVSPPPPPPHMAAINHMHQAMSLAAAAAAAHGHAHGHGHGHGLASPHGGLAPGCLGEVVDADPRDLEAFAERFKQRRIKLGVTQADVGSALANLKIPGVGSLSQSTICRFESLTLSHNNMIALKPILQAWLEEAEKSHREKLSKPELFNGADKKRKRTSIAAPEKRSLEAYFAIQPRPSSEKIAAIAEKLDLKKNVVRVWFCNQRQKQKRMKYSAGH